MIDFDTLRTKYPHLGYAVYAFTPGGEVTLECLTPDGKSFKFTGPTMIAAIEAGFPDDSTDEAPAADAGSVFD